MFLGAVVRRIVLVLVLLGAVALYSAPYVYFEYFSATKGATARLGAVPTTVRGEWVDDYFVVQKIDAATYAIGEPRYYQGNYSYLLVGTARALLFDAGSGLRDLVPVVRSLTQLPVTVLPSHLHFDHVGALGRLERTALPDDAGLQRRLRNGALTLTRYEFLGAMDRLEPPTFRVDEWWHDRQWVDLGDRSVQILHTPGHTATSVSVWEPSRSLLLVGDFIYPGELYAFLPGASLSAYLETSQRLLRLLPPAARLYAAHMQDPPAVPAAPLLQVKDLQSLAQALVARREGRLDATGFYPRRYPVTGPMTLATGLPWNLR